MKKAFLLSIAVVVLAGIVWFNVSAAGNVPFVEITLYTELFTEVKPGAHVTGGLYTPDENIEELSCVTMSEPGYISCQIPQTYAGQQLLIQLTKNGIMYTGLIDIPAR